MGKQHGTRTGNDKMMRVLISSREYSILEQLARLHNTSVSEIVRCQVRAIVSASSTLIPPAA